MFCSYKSIIISYNKYTIYMYTCTYIKSNIVFYSLSDYKKITLLIHFSTK